MIAARAFVFAIRNSTGEAIITAVLVITIAVLLILRWKGRNKS